MFIVDCEKKGNLVRFYLGNDPEYCGNGWNRYPYEDHANIVGSEYILGYKDIAFPFDSFVQEPSNRDGGGINYCRNDFKEGIVPCIVVADPAENGDNCGICDFVCVLGYKDIIKYYFGDEMEPDVVHIGRM